MAFPEYQKRCPCVFFDEGGLLERRLHSGRDEASTNVKMKMSEEAGPEEEEEQSLNIRFQVCFWHTIMFKENFKTFFLILQSLFLFYQKTVFPLPLYTVKTAKKSYLPVWMFHPFIDIIN